MLELKLFILKRYKENESWLGALIVLAHSEDEARAVAIAEGYYYDRNNYEDVKILELDEPKVVWNDEP